MQVIFFAAASACLRTAATLSESLVVTCRGDPCDRSFASPSAEPALKKGDHKGRPAPAFQNKASDAVIVAGVPLAAARSPKPPEEGRGSPVLKC